MTTAEMMAVLFRSWVDSHESWPKPAPFSHRRWIRLRARLQKELSGLSVMLTGPTTMADVGRQQRKNQIAMAGETEAEMLAVVLADQYELALTLAAAIRLCQSDIESALREQRAEDEWKRSVLAASEPARLAGRGKREAKRLAAEHRREAQRLAASARVESLAEHLMQWAAVDAESHALVVRALVAIEVAP